MKKLISHIIAFLLSISLFLVVAFVFFQIELRASLVTKTLKKINYEEEIHQIISEKVDNYIINDKLKNAYLAYINKDLIKDDLNELINNIYSQKDITINHYRPLYHIVSEYSKNELLRKEYATEVDNIYAKNLFPQKEFQLIHKLYLKTKDVLLIIGATLICLVIFYALLFIINKNWQYHITSLIATGILCLLPFIIIKCFHIFDNIIYNNSTITNFFLQIPNHIAQNLLYVSIGIFLITIAYYLLKKGLFKPKK